MNVEHIFRAYDIRGVFNRDLTPEVVTKIGIAFGTFLGGNGTVCVGRDARVSSELIEHALISGIISTGVNVVAIGLVPIHAANFKTLTGNFNAGCYITASHNPPEYNGIRFRHPDGSGYTVQNTKIKNIFLNGDDKFIRAPWDKLGYVTYKDHAEVIRDYCEFHIKSTGKLERALNIVLDPGNGTAALTAPYIFTKLGCELITINSEIDGRFPGRSPDPNAESLTELQTRVRDTNADFGVGYDGDGDRCMFVDDKGKLVQIEKIGVILARELLKSAKSNKVIANVSCSMIIDEEVQKLGGEVIRVRVGDVFISEAINSSGAALAVESSAHFFIPEHYVFDDPVLATIKLAEILAHTDKPLSAMVRELPDYPRRERTYPCTDNIKFQVVEQVGNSIKSEGARYDRTDGVKLIYEDGWILIRASNTEPLIRLVAEARTNTKLSRLVRMFETKLAAILTNK
jgi:phosphoglucosamine mutase